MWQIWGEKAEGNKRRNGEGEMTVGALTRSLKHKMQMKSNGGTILLRI